MPDLVAAYEERQGTRRGSGPPTRWTARQPTGRARPSARWHGRCRSIWAFGACTVYRLVARAAAAAVWARVRPVVDIALASVDVAAVVYVMRGAFKRRHLLAETSRHLAYVLRGRPHQPGLDEQIVQAVVDDYTRPAGRRMITADLRALYPCEAPHDVPHPVPDARHRMRNIRCPPPGGLHPGGHPMPMPGTPARTTTSRRTGAHHPTMPGTLARTRCPALKWNSAGGVGP
ncbi:hypothetical protein [Streptomyces sp. NBC_01102]|uniref:hypothetical protein n=1 Tax=Streptomyces sp. NBC_01102 TaxID=2903749 RepID=UPI0038638A45